MTEIEFNNITKSKNKYKFSSLCYLEYKNCIESTILYNDNNMVILYDQSKGYAEINYAVNDYNDFINYLNNINGCIKVNFISHEYKNALEKICFVTLCEFMDYWNKDLTKLQSKFSDSLEIKYLDINECKLASVISKKCINLSRGFLGESEEWYKDWIKENKIIKILESNTIIGYCCVSIYSDGTVLWIREIAIDPEYQRKGYGRKLFEHALVYGIKNNVKKIFWAVDKLNKNAIELYKEYEFICEDENGELQMIRYK